MIDTTGVILAGGLSSRMGLDKAFLSFSGRPLVEMVIDRLRPLFSELVIVSNNPKIYKKHNLKVIQDILPRKGPLGGIYTGLVASENNYNFIVACDMPFLNPGLIRHLTEEAAGFDAVVPKFKGRYEPLCAIYSKGCIRAIEERLSKGELKIRSFFKDVKVKIITESEISKFDPRGLSFLNVNTPSQYHRYSQIAESLRERKL
jgi:molybdopterin-guanine dinucleotide biosynthesis protein A